ncbi:unnamed protein product [Ambrosiozyma monospora]|uniref:Unnamed protein product n=1 Tax=Ambrosiozyma monospora TaxID=43982 RepID=A0A9W7DHW0_AMBMO|nr:unnamed protein product [Ambrosiozyma monospora]
MATKGHKTVGGRFNVMTLGLLMGFGVGMYFLKDYQIIKRTPPSPENFDENGNWKHKSFLKVKFTDHVQELELTPEAKQRLLEEQKLKKAQDVSAENNDGK